MRGRKEVTLLLTGFTSLTEELADTVFDVFTTHCSLECFLYSTANCVCVQVPLGGGDAAEMFARGLVLLSERGISYV